ncbi:MAG: DoxX family protein, partial [Halobaculum sp.]
MEETVPRRVVTLLAAVATLSVPATAHVDYVTTGDGDYQNPIPFLIEVFSDPFNALLFAGGAAATGLAVAGYLTIRPFQRDISVARQTLRSYEPYLPWMLRLSLGLPLVGAGFAGYLFSPAVQTTLRLPQVVLGFFLLFGLATRYVAVAGLLTYLGVLVAAWPTPLLAFEYVGGFLA